MKKKDETEIGIIIDDDEKLKIFGELLSNKTSRDLMRFLMSESAYKMKISDELGVKFSLIEHHLKKLENLGLVEITNKKIIKKGVLHKNYKINAEGIFIMLNTKEKNKEKGILKKVFKSGIKFASIGIVSLISWFVMQPQDSDSNGYSTVSSNPEALLSPLVIALLIIIIGLIIERLFLFKKKEKRD